MNMEKDVEKKDYVVPQMVVMEMKVSSDMILLASADYQVENEEFG